MKYWNILLTPDNYNLVSFLNSVVLDTDNIEESYLEIEWDQTLHAYR